MNFFKNWFGGGAQKHEDKGDELRLDFDYKDAAYYYQEALDALGDNDTEAASRLQKKLREVRRSAFTQMIEDVGEFLRAHAFERAEETLETAGNFADDDTQQAEVDRKRRELTELLEIEDPHAVERVDEVSATDDEIFELALGAYAEDERERLVALGPGFREAYTACQEEDWKRAGSALSPLLKDHAEEPLVLELAALVAEHTERTEEAIVLLEQVRKLDELRPQSVLSLAALYEQAGRLPDARNVLSAAATAKPPTAEMNEVWVELHTEYAQALARGGNYDDAVSALAAMIDVKSADRGRLFFNLAGVLEPAGRREEARAALERAIEADARRAIYRERLSDFLVKHEDDLDLALALLVQANEVETTGGGSMFGGSSGRAMRSPNRARYLYKMARIYYLKGDDYQAEKNITIALTVSQDETVTEALHALREEVRGGGTPGDGEPGDDGPGDGPSGGQSGGEDAAKSPSTQSPSTS